MTYLYKIQSMCFYFFLSAFHHIQLFMDGPTLTFPCLILVGKPEGAEGSIT